MAIPSREKLQKQIDALIQRRIAARKAEEKRSAMEDPVTFCREVLLLEPFEYQARLLRDPSKQIVVCAGRQVGKSTVIAARALWFAFIKPYTTTLIVGAALRQSVLLFNKILGLITRSPILKKGMVYHSRTMINFSKGSWVVALPSGPSGDTIRGFTADQIIFDEASFIPEQIITQVGLPMLLTTNGVCILSSTPYDKNHIFYKAFSSPDWSKYHWESSLNPLASKDFLERQRELVGELVYSQEYLARFIDDQKSYFPMSLLATCLHDCGSPRSPACDYCASYGKLPIKGSNLYGGFDPGGAVDPAAFAVVERSSDGSLKVVFAKTLLARDKKDENLYTRFTFEVIDLIKHNHIRKTFIDSTGLGAPLVELVKSQGVAGAEGMTMTRPKQEEIFSNLRVNYLERQRITLHPDDLTLLAHLNAIEYDRTQGGGFNFSHPASSSDDLGYALALACYAASRPSGSVVIIQS